MTSVGQRRRNHKLARRAKPAPTTATLSMLEQISRRIATVTAKEEAPYAAKRRANRKAPLDTLAERSSITLQQHSAGWQYARDWYRGTQPRSLTARYELAIRGTDDLEPVGQIEAYRRYRCVTDQVPAEELSVLQHVCLEERPVGQWDANRKRKKGTAIRLLRKGLDRASKLLRDWRSLGLA